MYCYLTIYNRCYNYFKIIPINMKIQIIDSKGIQMKLFKLYKKKALNKIIKKSLTFNSY